MPTNSEPLLQRVHSSFARLSAVASKLNTASDELAQAVSALDESLKTLNLGITCWHRYAGDMPDVGRFWADYIGYAKVGPKWGIALSKTSGHTEFEDVGTNDEWLFNDAPRALRIGAVEHIPTLIDKLIEAGEKTVDNIQAKATETKLLAAALKQPPAAPRRASTEEN